MNGKQAFFADADSPLSLSQAMPVPYRLVICAKTVGSSLALGSDQTAHFLLPEPEGIQSNEPMVAKKRHVRESSSVAAKPKKLCSKESYVPRKMRPSVEEGDRSLSPSIPREER